MNNIMAELRNAFKAVKINKISSVISIVGLGLGLACVIVISKYIYQEYMTDRFHERYDRIYYLTAQSSEADHPSLAGDFRLGKDLRLIPGIEERTRMRSYGKDDDGLVFHGERLFRANVLAVDSTFYKIFSFPMAAGDLRPALSDPGSIVITETLAGKIFGKTNPLGEPLKFWGIDYRVAGVMKDLPVNSSLAFDVLVPTCPAFYTRVPATFITLKESADVSAVNSVLASDRQTAKNRFLPFKGMYFKPDLDRGLLRTLRAGDSRPLFMLFIIGIAILVIAIFNYVNVYHVTLIRRSRELGVKKIFGGDNRTLWRGLWLENFLMVFWAVMLAVFLVYLLSGFIHREIGVPLVPDMDFDVLLLAGILLLLPLFISSCTFFRYRNINPADSIRNIYTGRSSLWQRQVLLGAQYMMTIAMTIVSVYFMLQLNYMLNRDIGLNRENVLRVRFFADAQYVIEKFNDPERSKFFVLRDKEMDYVDNELKKNPALRHICYGHFPLSCFINEWKNEAYETDYSSIATLGVDTEFNSLYGLKLKEGCFFDPLEYEMRGVVINESARKFFRIGDITNAYLQQKNWGKGFKVIGVVEDFRVEHLSKEVQPLVIAHFRDRRNEPVMMRITDGKEQEALAYLKNLSQQLVSGSDFSYEFFEDKVSAQYREDRKLVKIFSAFTLVAILISSMGLFGSSVFDVQQRYKEIGIRKINGAEISQIIMLLTSRFLKLVCIAFCVACPLAYLAISKYTEHFSVKAPLPWWLFAGAGLLTLLVVWGTLFWQSYRAASENPVKALQNE